MPQIKPKVMIILDTLRLGGPGKGLLQFLRNAEGLNCHLYCFKYGSGTKHEFAEEARRQGVHIRFFSQIFGFDPRPIIKAFVEVKNENYDILQTHGYKADVIGFFLKPLKKVKWISFAHGFTSENLKVKLYHRLDKILVRKADRVIAVSESLRNILLQNRVKGNKIRVIHNAVDMDDFTRDAGSENVRERYDISPKRPLIGVIGRLSHEKGQVYFLKACRTSLDRGAAFQAVLIGDGPDRELLNEYINKNGLFKNVRLVGYQKDIVSWYHALDILVLPSLSEGLPNVLLEAMLFNIPVIATDVGGVSTVINGENGILIPPGRPDIMTEKIVELVSAKSLRQKIAQKGRQSLYPRFSPEERSRAIKSIYRELLQ